MAIHIHPPAVDPLGRWQIATECVWWGHAWLGYGARVLALSVAVRAASAFLKALRIWGERPRRMGFRRAFRETFLWSSDPDIGDYLHEFFVGCLEFLVYPVLMATGAHAYIGAWLTFKVAAQWKRWGEDRAHFNRFLILNALLLLGSSWLSRDCVIAGFPV